MPTSPLCLPGVMAHGVTLPPFAPLSEHDFLDPQIRPHLAVAPRGDSAPRCRSSPPGCTGMQTMYRPPPRPSARRFSFETIPASATNTQRLSFQPRTPASPARPCSRPPCCRRTPSGAPGSRHASPPDPRPPAEHLRDRSSSGPACGQPLPPDPPPTPPCPRLRSRSARTSYRRSGVTEVTAAVREGGLRRGRSGCEVSLVIGRGPGRTRRQKGARSPWRP